MRNAPLSDLIKQFASRHRGMRPADVEALGYTNSAVGNQCNRLVEKGELFRAKVSHKVTYFFTDKARADAFLEAEPKPAPKRRKSPDLPKPGGVVEATNPNNVEPQIHPTPPPRFQVLDNDILSPKPVIRSGAFDFRRHMTRGVVKD